MKPSSWKKKKKKKKEQVHQFDVGKWVSQQNDKQKFNSIYTSSTNVQSQQK